MSGSAQFCAPQFRTILDIRRNLEAGAAEQARLFLLLCLVTTRHLHQGHGPLHDVFSATKTYMYLIRMHWAVLDSQTGFIMLKVQLLRSA